MPKMNMTVDNGLDDVKLESSEKLKSKTKSQEAKEAKKAKRAEKKANKKSKKNKNRKDSYLKEVAKEMKLVTWPTRKNVVKYSVATILMIVLLALFFIGVSLLFDLLYGLVQGWIG